MQHFVPPYLARGMQNNCVWQYTPIMKRGSVLSLSLTKEWNTERQMNGLFQLDYLVCRVKGLQTPKYKDGKRYKCGITRIPHLAYSQWGGNSAWEGRAAQAPVGSDSLDQPPWTWVLQLISTLLSVPLLTHHLFGYSRSHMFVLPAVAGCHCFWLYPGQQWSQVSPQVLCWHSHWNLQKWKPLNEAGLKFFFLNF